MENVKMTLSIVLPGSVLLSRKEARKDLKNNYNYESIHVDYMENGKKKHDVLNIKTRKCKVAKQVIKMTPDAYKSMTSEGEIPSFISARDWKRLSKKQRLDAHCQKICEDLGGISYLFEVFE